MKNRIIALAVGIALFLLPIILCGSNLNHRIVQDCVVDSFGTDGYYVWLDIYEPGGPVYDWIDITGIGTKVEGLTDDNNTGPFPIGFDFFFYGSFRNQFWVNANGAISFSDVAVYVPQGGSGFIIPSPNPPNDLVIPLGADLVFSGVDSAECYYYTNNVDTFIVSYINVAAWDTGPVGAHTFQLMLTGQDSCIYFQYSRQEGQFYNNANCAGIEEGGRGLQVFLHADPDSGYAAKIIPIAWAHSHLQNPGFEDWIGDSICLYWRKETGEFDVAKATSPWGQYGAKLILRSFETQRYTQYIASIIPGHSYEGSFWCFDQDLNIKTRLCIRWFDENGNPIDSFWSIFSWDTLTGWQDLNAGPSTAPAMAETAHFEIQLWYDNLFTDSAIMYVDEASFEDLSGVEEHPPKSEKPRSEIKIFPNPFCTAITIILPSTAHRAKSIELHIFDVTGRRVREISLLPFNFSLDVTWDGRDEAGKVASPGIYFLKLNGKPVGKVVKVR